MAAKKNELAKTASEDQLAKLRNEFPTEPTFQRSFMPRLGMYSQDVTEGRGRSLKVIAEAGTFYHERQDEEETKDPETGEMKRLFRKEEIGDSAEGIILFERKQLRMFDEVEEAYLSTPVYDHDDEIIPLFKGKEQIAKGTPKELQSRYMTKQTRAGKPKSALEENRILYVLIEGELFQLNLRGTSMYAYLTYKRAVAPNTVLTEFGSEFKEQGSIEWNQMTFRAVRTITSEEADVVIEKTDELKQSIAQEKAFFAARSEADDTFDSIKGRDEEDEVIAEEDLPFGNDRPALPSGKTRKK